MKAFKISIEKIPLSSTIKALKRAIETGIPNIRRDELVCDSVETMLKIMSRSKFEAFAAIVEHKPNSVLELAKILGKDAGNVSRDVKSLKALRLIELIEEKDGERVRMKPVAKYQQIIFDFKAVGHAGSF
jgi:predicted transcriptional regulator